MQGFHLSREIIIMIHDFRDVEMFDFFYDSFFLNRALDLFDGPRYMLMVGQLTDD